MFVQNNAQRLSISRDIACLLPSVVLPTTRENNSYVRVGLVEIALSVMEAGILTRLIWLHRQLRISLLGKFGTYGECGRPGF